MATTTMFNRQREKTMVMRTKFLFEIYMREGNSHLRNRQYKKAIESYDSALRLESSNLAALVGKSQCHLCLGHVKQALADVETALAIDNINPPAVLQKADIFYSLQNYEMALLFYHRGHKVSPEMSSFQEGIDNCQKRISDLAKGSKAMKLTEAGDLTIYVHKKMRKMTKTNESHEKRRRKSSPKIPSQPSSAGKTSQRKGYNPFLRLSRRQPVKLSLPKKVTNQNKRFKAESRASCGTVYSEPDEKTMKEILGKLYGDRVYLQNFINQTDEEESRLDVEVNSIAENGLQFLLDRVSYWNRRRLPPDPTPSPPLSRRHSRQGSSTQRMTTESPLPRQKSSLWEREISDLIRVLHNEASPRASIVEEGIPGYRPYKKEKKKVKKLYFEFATYRPSSDVGERGRGGTGMDRQRDTQTTRMTDILEDDEEEEEEEEEDYILNYLTKELSQIEEAFNQEDFDQCRRMSVTCLQTVYNYSKDDIADKLDLIAKIHSILGNTLLEQGDFEEARHHHEKDLEIGEQCKLDEAISRALGNLGRLYFQGKHIHKALGAFARKTKLVDRPEETAWLFHEIGDCFLTLNQYGYARDAGRKSLHAAEEAEHRMYQLQARVLIGVAQVKLRHYDDAYQQFERALDLARIEDDKESEEMITRALNEVNLRISERTKKESERLQDKKKRSLRTPLKQPMRSTVEDGDKVTLERVQEEPGESTEAEIYTEMESRGKSSDDELSEKRESLDTSSGVERSAKGENPDKLSGDERSAKGETPDKLSGDERSSKRESLAKSSGDERSEKGENTDKLSGDERSEKGENTDKLSGDERSGKTERLTKSSGDERSAKGENPDQSSGDERSGKRESPDKTQSDERSAKGESLDKSSGDGGLTEEESLDKWPRDDVSTNRRERLDKLSLAESSVNGSENFAKRDDENTGDTRDDRMLLSVGKEKTDNRSRFSSDAHSTYSSDEDKQMITDSAASSRHSDSRSENREVNNLNKSEEPDKNVNSPVVMK